MFSRGSRSTTWRPMAVWTAVTGAATAAIATTPEAWSGSAGDVDELLVAVCASGLAVALAWLWVITTATVVGLLAGRGAVGGGATRRLVLVACGAAVLAGTGVPAMATGGGDGPELLVGLSLPERAVAPVPHRHRRLPATAAYVVRPGDSLWSIARTHPGTTASVDDRWRAIWEANRDVVGDDPDLIIPGQALRLPMTHDIQDPSSDGDRP